MAQFCINPQLKNTPEYKILYSDVNSLRPDSKTISLTEFEGYVAQWQELSGNNESPTINENVQFYEGDITPDENTVFVFGSNPEGRHGAGAAKVAKTKFGAKNGQGEGLQGNAYALPTKRIRNIIPVKRGKMSFNYGNNKRTDIDSQSTFEAIINRERTATTRYESHGHLEYWKDLKLGDIVEFRDNNSNKVYVKITKPLTKLSVTTSAEEWSKKEGWSVDYFNSKVKPKINEAWQMEYEFVDAYGKKTVTSKEITESIKSLYEVAKQNPEKQFKIAYRNTTETSLNGYTGLEMIEMFNAAGTIPSNIIFSKEWFDTGKLNLNVPSTQNEANVTGGTLNVYWGGRNKNKSENSPERILSNLAPRKFTWEGREYGSVEHAYQSNKSGDFDQATYDKYIKVGGYGTKIKGIDVDYDPNNFLQFDNLNLLRNLIVESFTQNLNSEASEILVQYDEFTHNRLEDKNAVDRAFIQGLDLAKDIVIEQKEKQKKLEDEAKKPKFTYKGRTIKTEFQLSSDQENALKKLIDFTQSDKPRFTLQGAAGTGKTSIIGYLQKYIGGNMLYMAPTHAATIELGFATIKTGNQSLPKTVASSLKYDKDKKRNTLSFKAQRKLGGGKTIVVDETSMVSTEDYNRLKDLEKDGLRIIFLGDKKQIPEVVTSNNDTKNISQAFTENETVSLDTIHRTSNENIRQILQKVRDSKKFQLYKIKNNTDNVQFFTKDEEFNKILEEVVKQDPENTDYIGYTNKSVSLKNKYIREQIFGRKGVLQPGDIIMGYLGYASKQVEYGNLANSVSFKVLSSKRFSDKEYSGYAIKMQSERLENLRKEGVTDVPDEFSTNYIPLAKKGALENELSNQEYIKNRKYFSDLLSRLYDAKQEAIKTGNWPNFYYIQENVAGTLAKLDLDVDVIYNPQTRKIESFVSSPTYEQKMRFQSGKYNDHKDFVINKGIDYGHAITVHKSQGRTTKNVFFDAGTIGSNDTKILENGEQISTERQSLGYVGMSRASENLYVNEGGKRFVELPTLKETKVQQKNTQAKPTSKQNYPNNTSNALPSAKELNNFINNYKDEPESQAESQPTPSSNTNYNALFARDQDNLINGDELLTQSAVEAFDTLFFNKLFANYKDQWSTLFSNDRKKQRELYQSIVKDVYNTFEDVYNTIIDRNEAGLLSTEDADNMLANYDIILDSEGNVEFKKLIRLHQKKLKTYGFTLESREDTIKEEATSEELASKSVTDYWPEESLSVSFKDNASSNVKLLLAGLQNRIDSDTKISNSHFGIVTTTDFSKMFALIANKVANSTSVESMQAKLESFADLEYGINQLLDEFFNKEYGEFSQDESLTFLSFIETFSKNYNDYKFIFTGDNGVFHMTDAVVATYHKKLNEDWNSNHLLDNDRKPWFDISQGNVKYDQTWFRNNMGYRSEAKSSKDQWKQNLTGYINNTYKSSQGEGFGLRPEEYDNAVLSFAKDVFGMELDSSVDIKKVEYALEGIVQNILQPEKEGSNNLENIYGLNTDAKGFLDTITSEHLKVTRDYVENNFLSIDNKTKYAIQLNSYLTLVEQHFNEVNTLDELKQRLPWLNSTYSSDSLLLNTARNKISMYFDENGSRKKDRTFKMSFIDQLKREGLGNKGIETKNAPLVDRLLILLNSTSNSFGKIHQASDNSLARGYALHADFVKGDLKRMFSEATDIFTNYINTEIEYFRELNNEEQKWKNLVETEKDKNGKTIIKPLSHKSSMFTDFMTPSLLKKFDSYVKKGGKFKSNEIREALESYVNNLVEETKVNLNDLGALQGDVNNGLNVANIKNLQNKNKSESAPKKIGSETLKHTITQTILNRAIWGVEQTKLFTGHLKQFKNADNFYKRMGASVGTKNKTLADPKLFELYEKVFPRVKVEVERNGKKEMVTAGNRLYKDNDTGKVDTIPGPNKTMITRTVVFDDVKVNAKGEFLTYLKSLGIDPDSYKKLDEADAFSFAIPNAYRDMKLMNSSWSNEQEQLFNNIHNDINEPVYNSNGKATTFNILKPQYFAPLAEDGFQTGMYKLSTGILSPAMVNKKNEDGELIYPNMKKLYDYMIDNNIDMATFESANKVGTKLNNGGYNQLYDADGNVDPTNWVTQDTYTSYWGLQVETGVNSKYTNIKGSQMIALMLSNMYENGVTREGYTELADKYNELNSKLINSQLEKLKKEFDVQEPSGKYKPEALKRMVNILRQEAESRDANDNTLDSLDMLATYLIEVESSETGTSTLGFDVLHNRDKVENMLMSIAHKRVLAQKWNGGGFIQMPSTLFEQIGTGKARYKDDNLFQTSRELNLTSDGTLEVFIPHRFKEIYGELGEIPYDERLMEALGFRIPTSGMNSIEKIVVKGFLPQHYGDTIVLPSEIVAKAGSDYDVDKMFVYIPNYKVNYKQTTYDKVNEFIKNELLQDTRYNSVKLLTEILEKPFTYEEWQGLSDSEKTKIVRDNIKEVTRAIFDNDGEIAQMFKEEYGIGEVESIEYIEDDSYKGLQNQMFKLMRDIITKTHELGDGFHHLNPIGTDLFKEQQKRVDSIGLGTFTKTLFDVNYQAIVEDRNVNSKLLVGGAALHTKDHALAQQHGYYLKRGEDYKKIPFLDKYLNVENDRVLLGKRFNKDGVLISELLNQLQNASLDGAKDPILYDLNISFATMGIWAILIRSGMSMNKITDFMTHPVAKEFAQAKTSKDSQYLSSFGWKAGLKKKYGIDEKTIIRNIDVDSLTSYDNKDIMAAILELDGLNSDFEAYLQASRIDTEGTGKSPSEMDIRLKGADKIAKDETIVGNAYKSMTEGFFKPYYNALKQTRDVYGKLFKVNNPRNQDIYYHYDSMVEIMSESFASMNDKTKFLDKYKSDLIAAHVFKNEYKLLDNIQQPLSSEILKLTTGEFSVAKRLRRFKQEHSLLFTDRLTPMISDTVLKINGENRMIDGIKLFNQKLNAEDTNNMIASWRRLLEIDPELGFDLMKLTIAQSGLQLSPMTFTKLIPAEYYMEMLSSANEYGKSIDTDAFNTHFMLNNSKNNPLIKDVANKVNANFTYAKRYKEDDKAATVYVNLASDFEKKFGLFNYVRMNYPQFENKFVKVSSLGVKEYRMSKSTLSYSQNLNVVEVKDVGENTIKLSNTENDSVTIKCK